MEQEIKPCRVCGKMPVIKELNGIWYAYCERCIKVSYANMGKYSMYNICALSEKKVIAQWNNANGRGYIDENGNVVSLPPIIGADKFKP